MLYEAVLLFGVVFFAALAFSVVLQQRNGLVHHTYSPRGSRSWSARTSGSGPTAVRRCR
jgi:hypothetical protein